jgi:hypothetical protein
VGGDKKGYRQAKPSWQHGSWARAKGTTKEKIERNEGMKKKAKAA